MKTWWCIFGIIPILEAMNNSTEPPLLCPEKCQCDYVTRCQNMGLVDLPEGITLNTTSLDLSYNNIEHIPVGLNDLTNLRYLNLSNNKISTIGHLDMRGLIELKSLDLSFNLFHDWRDIHSEAFTHLKPLAYLDLSNNPLRNVPPFSRHFLINSLIVLNLNNCSMKNIPAQVVNRIPGLKEIHLENNPLTSLNETFKSNTLQLINLSGCLLEYINENAFKELTVLKTLKITDNHFLRKLSCYSEGLLHLDLSNSNLESIPIGNMRALINLNMQENFLKTLENNTFLIFPNLIELNLSLNAISFIEENTFRGLDYVQVIDLSLNKLIVISEKVFLPTITLAELNLSHNYISSIDAITSSSLKRLDISYCEIYNINKFSLSNLPKLTHLSLARNFISSIPDGWTADRLTSLNLNGCRIKVINNKTFTEMYYLKKLDLSGNRLTYIHPSFLPPNLLYIKLEDNQWRCDCPKLKSMFEALVENNERVDRLICDSPEKAVGMTWKTACEKEWSPSLNRRDQLWWYSVIIIITMTSLLLVMIALRKLNDLKEKRLREIEERRRIQEREAREALQRMQRFQREYRETENQNAPDPRDTQSPPSYNDALLLPRLDSSHPSLAGSLHSLASRGNQHGSSNDINKKQRVRRKRRRRKSDSSDTPRSSRVVIEDSDTTDQERPSRPPLESDF